MRIRSTSNQSLSTTSDADYRFVFVPDGVEQVEIELPTSVNSLVISLPLERRLQSGNIPYTTMDGNYFKGRNTIAIEGGDYRPQRLTPITSQLNLDAYPTEEVVAALRRQPRLQALLRDYPAEARRDERLDREQILTRQLQNEIKKYQSDVKRLQERLAAATACTSSSSQPAYTPSYSPSPNKPLIQQATIIVIYICNC